MDEIVKDTVENDGSKKSKKNKNFNPKRDKDGNDKKKFSEIVEEKVLPAFAKFGSFPILVTIRDAFALMIPVIIAGSVGILGSAFIFGSGSHGSALSTSIIGLIANWSGFVEKTTGEVGQVSWALLGGFAVVADVGNKAFSVITSATMGSLSLYAAFFVSWRWAALHDAKNPILAGLAGLGSFLIITQLDTFFFDAMGLLATLVTSFIVSQLYLIFERAEKLKIKLPDSVPPTVASGFSALFPILFVLLIMAGINTAAWSIGNYANIDITSKGEVLYIGGEYGFAGLFYKLISAPFLSFASSGGGGFGLGLFYVFMYGFFWFFGIHGGNVLNGVFYPIWFGLIATNAASIEAGMAATDSSLAVFNMAFFETYVMSTGWGLTGALVIVTQIFSKQKKYKEINKIAGPAAIFNINEPVTFGYPLMLNPVLGLAALFCMPIFTVFAWIFVGPLGWVNHSYVYVPWTTPVGLGAFLSAGMDWKAIILALTIFGLAILYYIPFVLINDKYEAKLDQKRLAEASTPRESAISKEADDIFAQAAKRGK